MITVERLLAHLYTKPFVLQCVYIQGTGAADPVVRVRHSKIRFP